MLRFNSIREFLNYRNNCIVCGTKLAARLQSSFYIKDLSDNFRSEMDNNYIYYKCQNESLEWQEAFKINLDTNIIESVADNSRISNLFLAAKFIICKYCPQTDFCGATKIFTHDLFYESLHNKVFHPLKAREKINLRFYRGRKIEAELLSDYKKNVSWLLLFAVISNPLPTDPYDFNFYHEGRQCYSKQELPLINIDEIESKEILIRKIKTLMVFN